MNANLSPIYVIKNKTLNRYFNGFGFKGADPVPRWAHVFENHLTCQLFLTEDALKSTLSDIKKTMPNSHPADFEAVDLRNAALDSE